MRPLTARRGAGDPRAPRDWYWSLVLLEYRSPRRWPLGLARLLWRPVDVAIRTAAEVRAHGERIRSRSGVGLARQAALLWWDGLRYSIRPSDWYRNELYLPAERHRVPLIFPARINYRLLHSLHHGAELELAETITSKVRFARWCETHGFPCAQVIGEVTREHALDPETLPSCDLFTKKGRGSGGDGAALWRWDGAGRWVGDDGLARDAAQLVAELEARVGPEGTLVQRRLRNHPALDGVARRGLCTARMITLRWPDGRVEHDYTLFRIPLGDSAVDNMSAGGLGAPVDTATGIVGEARHGYLDEELAHGRLAFHPDTGAPIAGLELPWWNDARALVERAHRALGGLAVVGWDVGLTPDGPVLVEANTRPGIRMSQRWEAGPANDSPYARCIVEHFERGLHYEAGGRRPAVGDRDLAPGVPAPPGATAAAAPRPLAGRAAAAPAPRSDGSPPDR